MGLKTLNQIKNELQEPVVINSWDAEVFTFGDKRINLESEIREALFKKSNYIEIEDLPQRHHRLLKKSGYIFTISNSITKIDLVNDEIKYCKICGKEKFNNFQYCSKECNPRYKKRKKETIEERSIRMKEQCRVKTLHQRYKLSKEDYNNLLVSQQEKCAICGKNADSGIRRLAIDHDHKTGNIRGLLCNSCNLGLGMFKDKIKNLQEAIKYLKNKNDGKEKI